MSTPSCTSIEFDDHILVKDTVANATPVKDVMAGPCRVTHIHATNGAAAVMYLKLYDNINPSVGTTDPVEIMTLRGSGTEGGVSDFPVDMEFEEGLSFACVTTGGTAGTTDPTSSVIVALTIEKESA